MDKQEFYMTSKELIKRYVALCEMVGRPLNGVDIAKLYATLPPSGDMNKFYALVEKISKMKSITFDFEGIFDDE